VPKSRLLQWAALVLSRHSLIRPSRSITIAHAAGSIARVINNVRRGHHEKVASIGATLLAGAALGAAAVQALHAQAKPPVYQITEIEFLDRTAYERDYVPKAQARYERRVESSLRQVVLSRESKEIRRRHALPFNSGTASRRSTPTHSAAFKELLPLRDKTARVP